LRTLRLFLLILLLSVQSLPARQIDGADSVLPAKNARTSDVAEQIKALHLIDSIPGSANAAYELSLQKFNIVKQKILSKRARYTDDVKYLRYIYRELFQSVLLQYKPFSMLDDALVKGDFDCLSGSLLFALIFEATGHSYTLYETNTHVYLTVQSTSGKEILIESTDPFYGFISGKTAIEVRKAYYKKKHGAATSGDGELSYRSHFDIARPVNLQGMSGLQFYNRAVAAYNAGSYLAAIPLLEKAMRMYPADRNVELMLLTTHQLLQQPDLQHSQRTVVLGLQHKYSRVLEEIAHRSLAE
jgi:tetratricopeptide (TPR) repeat protein